MAGGNATDKNESVPFGRVTRARAAQVAGAQTNETTLIDALEERASMLGEAAVQGAKVGRKAIPEPGNGTARYETTTPTSSGKRKRESVLNDPSPKPGGTCVKQGTRLRVSDRPHATQHVARKELYGTSESSVDSAPDAELARREKGHRGASLTTGIGRRNDGVFWQHVPSPRLRDTASVSPSTSPARGEEDLSEDGEADPHDKEMDEDYIPTGPGPMPKVPKLLKGSKKRPKKRHPPPVATDAAPGLFTLLDPAFANSSYHISPGSETGPAQPPPPPPPPAPDHTPEADPRIWDLGIDPPPLYYSIHRAPARPGNVYCEACFRDEVARWVRVRDGVVRILHLLGGGAALRELRRLSSEAEQAEQHATEAYLEKRSASRARLRSPPPAASGCLHRHGPGSEGQGGEHGGDGNACAAAGGSVTAKKMIIMAHSGRSWEAPHFSEYMSEVVGIVLLRILAERPTAGLAETQKGEVHKLLEGLRQEVGIEPRFFDAMTTACRGMLVQWRMAVTIPPDESHPSGVDAESRWWWEFDNALQDASDKVQLSTHMPSLFASTLATKARDAAIATLTGREAATAQNQITVLENDLQPRPSLAQMERILGMSTPRSLFLRSISDKLAAAKRRLEQQQRSAPSQAAAAAPDTGSGSGLPSDDALLPPAKRRKLSNGHAPPRDPEEPAPLACIYCSESDASRRYTARRASSYYDGDAAGQARPWTKTLRWAFPGLSPGAAARVRRAEDWFRLVASSRPVEVVDIFGWGHHRGGEGSGPRWEEQGLLQHHEVENKKGEEDGEEEEGVIEFMMDVTGARTRVVLVRMKGVFEILLGGRDGSSGGLAGGGGGGRGSRVRFAPPPVLVCDTGVVVEACRTVGRWEDWRAGELKGFRLI